MSQLRRHLDSELSRLDPQFRIQELERENATLRRLLEGQRTMIALLSVGLDIDLATRI